MDSKETKVVEAMKEEGKVLSPNRCFYSPVE